MSKSSPYWILWRFACNTGRPVKRRQAMAAAKEVIAELDRLQVENRKLKKAREQRLNQTRLTNG